VDLSVKPTANGTAWELVDLFGRSMGSIRQAASKAFTIHPEGHALMTMAGMKEGPHPTLDAALAEIEKHTRGVCRRDPGENRI
jgi:hypothetical protein